jgi:hypothetical protein
MLILRPTATLARRLKIVVPGGLVGVERPYADWCVHAFSAGRRPWILVANTASLFSVVTTGRGVAGDGELTRAVLAALREYLHGSDRAFFFARFVEPEAASATFAPIGRAALRDAMKELASHARWFMARSDLSPFETADRVNQTSLGFLRGRTPAEVFPELVGPNGFVPGD